jgi:hypothetical protein
LKAMNKALSFLVEISMLAAYAYFGFTFFTDPVLPWVFGLGLPAVLIAVWGVLLAPKSRRRLKEAPGLALSSALFILAALLLMIDNQGVLGVILLALSVANRFLTLIWKQW